MKLALVIGHHHLSPGVTLASGQTENGFNAELARQLRDVMTGLGADVHVFARSQPSYSRSMEEVVRALLAFGPDLVLELHSNGSESGARGSEALYWPETAAEVDVPEATPRVSGSHAWASHVSAGYAEAIGIKDRGAHVQTRSWNGSTRFHPTKHKSDGSPLPIPNGPWLALLREMTVPTCIGESHFMTHPEDHFRALKALDEGTLAAKLGAHLAEFHR